VPHDATRQESPAAKREEVTGDPNAAISYGRGNGGPTLDQRAVVDGGFAEMVRLGELPITVPDVRASLTVLDKQISVSSPSGTALTPCLSRRRLRRRTR
jgi:glucoamylase